MRILEMQIQADSKGKVALDDITLWARHGLYTLSIVGSATVPKYAD